MIALHYGEHRLRHAGELDQAGWRSLGLQREHADRGWGNLLDIEDSYQLLLGQARWGVEKVQNL